MTPSRSSASGGSAMRPRADFSALNNWLYVSPRLAPGGRWLWLGRFGLFFAVPKVWRSRMGWFG
jgi:hypothetical protein